MDRACPYQILGVSRGASATEVCRAWRRLTLEYHPDKRPGDPTAGAKFAALTRARDILLDPSPQVASASATPSRKRKRKTDGTRWGDLGSQTKSATPSYHSAPTDDVLAARRAAATANKKVLETKLTQSRTVATEFARTPEFEVADAKAKRESQINDLRILEAEAIFRGKKVESSLNKSSRCASSSARAHNRKSSSHLERLISFETQSDCESSASVASSVSSCSDSEETQLDSAFGHALRSWQADTLSNIAQAPRRFLCLMSAKDMRPFRPGQKQSVLFIYDYASKVLYEYIPDDETCELCWTPAEPTVNEAIWALLPLPPAWLRKIDLPSEDSPGHLEFILPAGCLRSIRPGHDGTSHFCYDVGTKTLFELHPQDGTHRVLWTPDRPSENVLIWTILPLPPDRID